MDAGALAARRGGARMIDVGGESGVTNRPAVDARRRRSSASSQLIERITGELGALRVGRHLQAGGGARGDRGRREHRQRRQRPARPGAGRRVRARPAPALVLMHTRAEPKRKLLDPSYDGRIVADVRDFLAQRIELALGRGVAFEQLMLDPGPDFAKTPAQTVEVLRALRDLHEFGRPAAARRLAQGLRRRDHRPCAARPARRNAGRDRSRGRRGRARAPRPRRRGGGRLTSRCGRRSNDEARGRFRAAARPTTLRWEQGPAESQRRDPGAPRSALDSAARIAGRWPNATGAHR